MRSHNGTHSAAAPPIFLLIPCTPSTVSSTAAAPISIENVGIYLVITIFTRVNIVYKWVTRIVKDV